MALRSGLRPLDVNAVHTSPARDKGAGRRRQVRGSPQRLSKSQYKAAKPQSFAPPQTPGPGGPTQHGSKGTPFFTPSQAGGGGGAEVQGQFLKQAEAAIEAASHAARSPAFKVPQAAASVLRGHLGKARKKQQELQQHTAGSSATAGQSGRFGPQHQARPPVRMRTLRRKLTLSSSARASDTSHTHL